MLTAAWALYAANLPQASLSFAVSLPLAEGREQSFEEWLRSPQPRIVGLVRHGPRAFGIVVRLPSGELVTSPLSGGARFVMKPPPPYGECRNAAAG